MTRDEALALGRQQGAPLGGQAVKDKASPQTCLRCGQPTVGRTWHSYLGHLGLHGLADRYFGGDIAKAQERLRRNGLAVQDSACCPQDTRKGWNGAWPKYCPVTTQTKRPEVAEGEQDAIVVL